MKSADCWAGLAAGAFSVDVAVIFTDPPVMLSSAKMSAAANCAPVSKYDFVAPTTEWANSLPVESTNDRISGTSSISTDEIDSDPSGSVGMMENEIGVIVFSLPVSIGTGTENRGGSATGVTTTDTVRGELVNGP